MRMIEWGSEREGFVLDIEKIKSLALVAAV